MNWTPSTGRVRDAYIRAMRNAFIASAGEHAEEFDRWLAQVKREAAADALDEAAAALVVDRVEGSTYSAGLPLVTAEWASAHTERWLRARAASIRSGATS